jgi:hypothetical protein
LAIEEAAAVLKKYLKAYPITKPYFDAQVDASLDEFVEEAKSRPVFELTQSIVSNNQSRSTMMPNL